MRPKVLTCITAIAAISALTILVQFAEAQQAKQPPRYYVFRLGDPGGGNSAAAASINSLGWIAGDALQPGNTTEHAELWVGVPVDLNTLGGPNSAVAWPNKNHGQIAGITETADMNPLNEAWSCAQANLPSITNHVCFGFIWEDGVMTALPPLPGGMDSYAAGINNKGQVAGWAENGFHDPTCNNAPPANQVLQFEAVVWGPKLGEMTQLFPLSPDPDSAAHGNTFAHKADDPKQLSQRQAARGGEMVDARFGGIEHIEIDMKIGTTYVCLDFRQPRLQRCTQAMLPDAFSIYQRNSRSVEQNMFNNIEVMCA